MIKTFTISITILSIILNIDYTAGCGMITHNEISLRALFQFQPNSTKSIDYKQWILNNLPYFQAGSVFPDSGYLCQQPYGEPTHWPPFINGFAEYIMENYNQTDTRYQQLVAFLFGIISHDEADVIWHWGPTGATDDIGFLRSMAHGSSDCRDTWNSGTDPTCHTIGDNGADFYLAYRGNINYFEFLWKVPFKELGDFYRTKMQFNVSDIVVEGCLYLMNAGAQLEIIGGGYFFDKYGQHTAFLNEELDSWFAGGIDDMAINVQWKWNRLISILEGVKGAKKLIGKKYQNIRKKEFFFEKDLIMKYSKILNIETKYDENNNDLVVGQQKSIHGKEFIVNDIKNELQQESQTIFENYIKRISNSSQSDASNIKIQQQQQPKKDNSREDIQQKIKEFEFLQQNQIAKYKFQSDYPYSYFGKSITTGDYDGDGDEEAFISAPGYSKPGEGQKGALYLLNFSKQGGIDIDYDDYYLSGENLYSRFGYSVATADLNRDGIDDLIVSEPTFGDVNFTASMDDYYPKKYYGRVNLYFGQKGVGIQKRQQPNITIVSSSSGDDLFNFGFQLSIGDCNGDGYPDLLIGSPFAQQKSADQQGHVAVFTDLSKYNDGQQIDVQDAAYQFYGQKNFQWFGYSLQCRNNLLIVGSPGARDGKQYEQASGAVYGYNLTTKQQVFQIISDSAQSKFGHSLDIDSHFENIAVGAPSLTKDTNYQSGGVYIFNLSDVLQKQLNYLNMSSLNIQGHSKKGRFGSKVLYTENGNLIVSSNLQSETLITEEGYVYLYAKSKLEQQGIIDYNNDSILKITNWQQGSRYGESLHLSKDQKTLIVGAPYWSSGVIAQARIAGEVNFYDVSAQKLSAIQEKTNELSLTETNQMKFLAK